MLELITETADNLVKAVIVLFIIVDPLGNIPIFMSLTEEMSENQKNKVFKTAILVAFILLLIFSLTGQQILNIFGVSIFSFEIAGGILLLIIAIKILLTGSLTDMKESPESVGAVPLAMPLLVGPGAITTTILNLQYYGVVITAISVFVVLILSWAILRYVNVVYRFLGKMGALIIARVMAMLIAAIAVQYVLIGLMHFMGIMT